MASGQAGFGSENPRGSSVWGRLGALVGAIRAGDSGRVEEAVLALSRLRRLYAPLAFAVGALAMLFDGLKMLISNWRLGLIQVIPAVWVWLAMLDLKLHVLRGRDFRQIDGTKLGLLILMTTVVTMAAFFLNGVFAFALASPGVPRIRPAWHAARSAGAVLLGWGLVEGAALGVAAFVSGRWGRGWFALTLGTVVGCIMFSYVAIPSRLLGVRDAELPYGRRDRFAAALIGGLLGAIVCTPPYLLGRLGIVMLGSKVLIGPAVIMLTVGFGLQAGAAGSVKAIRMSAKLAPHRQPDQPGSGRAGRSTRPAGDPMEEPRPGLH